MHNKEIKTVEQLAHHRLYDTKDHSNSYSEKDGKLHIRGHRPNITTSGSKYSCLTTRSKLWPKRPTKTNIPCQPVPRRPKLPPGNPRLLVDVNKETTLLLGDVLL